MVCLPAGFVLVLVGGNLPLVLVGEALFGWALGVIYYAALYYAMVVKNASVEAGGGHEMLIGSGFVLGPAAGLIGVALRPAFGGSDVVGILATAGGLFLVCVLSACRAISRVERSDNAS